MADTLESLEIEVLHSSTGAADSIYEITESIRQMGKALGDVLPQVKSFATSMKDVGKTKSSWGEKQQAKLETPDVSGVQSLLDSLDGADIDSFSETLVTLYGDLDNIVHAVGDVGRYIKEGVGYFGAAVKSICNSPIITFFKNATSAALRFASSLGKIGANGVKSAIRGIANSVDKLKERVKKSMPAVSNFLKSLKRIALYRFLRTIIKEITQAFQEGLENAYAFSQGIATEGYRFAEAMDAMSTAGLTMKNQLGSAFIALLAAIQPIINAIIAGITRLANAISQVFSAFTGSTYLKAADVPKKWGEAAKGAGKAAKEWKNQLMGFDEINKLEAPSDGGGSGSDELDPSTMFKDSPISENIKKFVDELKAKVAAEDWQGLGTFLGEKINSIFPTTEQWEAWGKKIGNGLDGAIQTMYFMLKTIDFHAIGSGIATFLNNALEEINFEYLGGLLIRKITAALDFLLGFLGTLNWGEVGESIFKFLMGAMLEASDWLASKDWDEIGRNLFTKVKELISALNFPELAQTFFRLLGLAFGAVAQLADEFLRDFWENLKSYFQGKVEEAGGNVVKGFFKAIVDAFAELFAWFKTTVLEPFTDGFSISFDGISQKADAFREKIRNFFHIRDDAEEAEANIDTTKAAFENLDISGTTALSQLDATVSASADNIVTSMTGITTATNDMNNAFLGGTSTGESAFGEDPTATGGVDAVISKFQEMSAEATVTGDAFNYLATTVSDSTAAINDSFVTLGESWDINATGLTDGIEEVKTQFENLQIAIEDTTANNVAQFDLMSNSFVNAETIIVDGIGVLKEAVIELNSVWRQCMYSMTWSMLDFALYTVEATGYVVEALLLIEKAAIRAAMAMMILSAIMGVFGGGGGGGVKTSSVPAFASGGFPEDGLFMANHGEMVGQFSNGKTAVANNKEITDGIAQATYAAFMQAMSDSGSNKKNNEIVLNINGREFARATYDDTKEVAREHGTPLVANA